MLGVFLVLYFGNYSIFVQSCGRNRGDGGGEHTHGGSTGGCLQHFMGNQVSDSGSVSSTNFDANSGGTDSFSKLSCSSRDTKNCCWRQHPQNDIEWKVATGRADPAPVRSHFGNDRPPDGPGFLAACQDDGVPAGRVAVLESCAVPCTENPIAVSLSSWQSDGTKLEVCTLRADSNNVEEHQNCREVPEGSTSVSIPGMVEPFRILLLASEFTDSGGSMVAIDKVDVSGQLCDEVFTTGPTTRPGTDGICKALQCSFDANDKCSYQEASGSKWQVTQGRTGNPSTGIRRAPQGSDPYYAGVNLAPEETAVLRSGRFSSGAPKELKFKLVSFTSTRIETDFTDAAFDFIWNCIKKQTIIIFQKYEATFDVELKACVNGESDCPYRSDKKVTTADRQWSEHSIPLDSTVQEVFFVAKNTGTNHGAAGIDDIRVFSQSGQAEC